MPSRPPTGAVGADGDGSAAGERCPPAADIADPLVPGRLGTWAGWVLAVVATAVLFTMMVVTFIDVFGRKLLAKPLYGGYEITEFLMGTLIFCTLPLVSAREGHVTIDVFDRFVPVRWRRGQQTVVTAISGLVLASIAWRLWLLSAEHMRHREVTMTLHIPHGPFSRLFAVTAGVAALACLVLAWEYLRGERSVRSGLPAG
ncbi:MAG: TRAP transporter small permease [Candidatus Rokuibacteriota bacterium]